LAALRFTRGDAWTLGWLVLALAGLIGAQVVFWIYTYPANVATSNWTFLPETWQALRARWEYSRRRHLPTDRIRSVVVACLSRVIGRR
jgi:hypothetical protein